MSAGGPRSLYGQWSQQTFPINYVSGTEKRPHLGFSEIKNTLRNVKMRREDHESVSPLDTYFRCMAWKKKKRLNTRFE